MIYRKSKKEQNIAEGMESNTTHVNKKILVKNDVLDLILEQNIHLVKVIHQDFHCYKNQPLLLNEKGHISIKYSVVKGTVLG